jgi:NRPS condensation-like uncharacterized protein
MMEQTRQYLFTERAHYMCPNMHFGLMLRLKGDYDAGKVQAGLAALQAAHPFARSVIAEEPDGRLYYSPCEDLPVPLAEKADPAAWAQDYDDFSREGWDVHSRCLLRALAYPGEGSFHVLLVAHHLLCDGRGLLQLAEEFAAHYHSGAAPACVPEQLIAALSDLPPRSDLPWISKVIIGDANKRWQKENHRVTFDAYAAFEKQYLAEHPVQRSLTVVPQEELSRLQEECRRQDVSLNDCLIARMMKDEQTSKVIIAEDIRKKLRCYRPGAMGNYATAFSVVVKKPADDLFALSRQVHRQVQRILARPSREMLVLACYMRMDPQLLDAVAISTLGGFDSEPGVFVGTNMFGFARGEGCSVTNLGQITSEVIEDAFFIPPASPANRITQGVLTVNGRMNLCTARKEA